MAVYADLGPIDYFRYARASWRAVGWLGAGHPFPQGEVSPEFLACLGRLLRLPWQRWGFLGFHTCDLCPPGAPPHWEKANVWIPDERCVYVAPSMISHYILVHRYSPPSEFVDAVLRCPEMNSPEYHRALADAGF